MPPEIDRPYVIADTNFVSITPGDPLHTVEAPKTNQKVTESDAVFTLRRPRDPWGQEAVFQLLDKQSIFPDCEAYGSC